MQKVLITGATGLIGQRLTLLLAEKGFQIHHLGRTKTAIGDDLPVKSFTWDIGKGKIEKGAFDEVVAVVHLAGAGVAEKRWSDERKKEIIDSRVESAALLARFLKTGKHQVKTFVSASAVGYYGDCGSEIIREEHAQGAGFLAEVCRQWEQGAMSIGKLGIREIRCRIGIVLAANGGALPQLTKTLPLGIAGYFSKKDLYYPWIHIDDVCGIFIHALENEKVHGPFNTTAPEPLPLKDLMAEIIRIKKSGAVLLPTPPIAIKFAMGEMSEMLLGSQRCSAEKITDAGYRFKFGKIEKALKNIYP